MTSSNRFSYRTSLNWTGNRGSGTSGYAAYERDYTIAAAGKPPLLGSSDPAFRGDESRYNPEDLLLASLSACHMLWYLHLCTEAGVTVTAYEDDAQGEMETDAGGGGKFTTVVLRPRITITPDSDPESARALHRHAHDKCFIASSVNFPVTCEPVFSPSSPKRTS